jgi:hypothetical protein
MSDIHAETYIVEVDRKAGVTTVEIQRNDGNWYDEEFTVVGRTAEVAEWER